MDFTKESSIARLIYLTVLAILFFSPAATLAKQGMSGNLTVGAGALSLDEESFKYGEYNGLYDDSLYFIGDASLNYTRDDYIFNLEVEDAGLESRRVNLEGGEAGSYSLSLEYNELPHLISNSGSSVYNGSGSNNLTLPAGFGQYSTTGGMPLSANLRDLELELKRVSGKIRYSQKISQAINFKVSFEREKKEGVKSIGGSVGTKDDVYVASVILPEPVNYVSDELKGSIRYSKETVHARMEYYLSQFNNDYLSLEWENPFAPAAFPDVARLSLPPNNRHQRLSFSGGLNLPASSRVSMVAEYGKMEQKDNLLDYSVNGESPPRKSADAEIETQFLKINASSRPLPDFAVSANISHYKSDNKTPFNNYSIVMNDTGSQSLDFYNLPEDHIDNKANLNLLFKLTKETSLKLGWTYNFKARGYRAVKKNKENTYRVKLASHISSFLTGSAKYLSSTRKALMGSEYNQSTAFGGYTANDPDLRQYDIADNDREMYDLNLVFYGPLNSALSLNYKNDSTNFKESLYGLQERLDKSYLAELTLSPMKYASINAYYTKEAKQSAIVGESWEADIDDHTDTIGLGAEMLLLRRRLLIRADYSNSISTGSVSFPPVVSSALPDRETELSTLNLKAEYNMSKKLSIGLAYKHEKFTSSDWSVDGLNPSTIDNVLSIGGGSQDYDAQSGTIFATVKL